MREAFFTLSTDWKEGINWANVRDGRLKRTHAEMEKAGVGALLLFYDENMRFVSSTLTPGWDRNMDLLMDTVAKRGFPVGEDILRGFRSGAQDHITFGRNEPALGHYHGAIKAALECAE